MTPWGSKPLPNFKGVAGEKLVMGITASTSAGGAAYYYTPQVIAEFRSWLKANKYPMAGFMLWDSHWDTLNKNAVSKACSPL
jgi:chitinase